MYSKNFWSRVLSRSRRADARPSLRVQPLGLTKAQIQALRPVCSRLGEALDMLVEIDLHGGDLVLADRGYAQRQPPALLARQVDARPLVTCDLDTSADPGASVLALFERRQRELLVQLRELPLVRGLSPQFGASGWDPEVLPMSPVPSGFGDTAADFDAPAFTPAQDMLITWLLRGLMDPSIKPLVAGYGPGALIRIDFAHAYALVDPLAQQALRVRREAPAVTESGAPGADAIERDLQGLVWDFGIAMGRHRLLDQPADWWNTPLSTTGDNVVQQYTRLPRHLELAATLFSGRITPAELQVRTGQSVAELRPFLQACLFLGLAWWSPEC